MSNKDYIPAADRQFLVWIKNLLAYVQTHLQAWGLDSIILEPIEMLANAYETALTKAENPNRGKADIRAKNEARDTLKTETRVFVKARLAYNPVVTDEDREMMGLPVHDRKPTRVADPSSRPELEVDFSAIQKHVLHVTDSVSKSAARPAGIAGFEIWRKVGGDAPVADSDWTLVVQATRSPHALAYAQTETGLRAYYRLRWVNTRGVTGDWSETVSAIIA